MQASRDGMALSSEVLVTLAHLSIVGSLIVPYDPGVHTKVARLAEAEVSRAQGLYSL